MSNAVNVTTELMFAFSYSFNLLSPSISIYSENDYFNFLRCLNAHQKCSLYFLGANLYLDSAQFLINVESTAKRQF